MRAGAANPEASQNVEHMFERLHHKPNRRQPVNPLPKTGDNGLSSVPMTATSRPEGSPQHASHPSVRRAQAALEALGATGEVVVLPQSTRTAAEAAAALGCDIGAIANSLVFATHSSATGEGEPVLILTSGAHRVDTELCAMRLGVEALRRADADFVRRHTGQAIGGVAPVGHPAPLRTVVDRWLQRHPQVWAAAGHPHALFATSYDELLRLTNGTPIDVN